MAIKTKKISDLVEISVSSDVSEVGSCDFDKSNFYVLACKDSVTGKLPLNKMFTSIRKLIDFKTASLTPNTDKDSKRSVSIEDNETISSLNALKQESSQIVANITSLTKAVDNLQSKVNSNAFSTVKRLDDVEESLANALQRIEALEGFVQALQKDGYLTLAEIRKAAASACPICTHTHEEK